MSDFRIIFYLVLYVKLLLLSTIIIGPIVSIIGIILVRKKKSTPVPGYVVDKNGYLRKEMDINCVNNDENSLKSGWSE